MMVHSYYINVIRINGYIYSTLHHTHSILRTIPLYELLLLLLYSFHPNIDDYGDRKTAYNENMLLGGEKTDRMLFNTFI